GQPKELVALLGSNRGRHWAALTCLAHSPEGKYLVCGSENGALCLWDATTLREVARFHAHKGHVNAVAFSPNGQLVASGSEEFRPKGDPVFKGEVKLWDVPTGKLRATLTGHIGRVSALSFSPDGQRLVSAGVDKTARVWDLTKNPPQLQAKLCGHDEHGTAVV